MNSTIEQIKKAAFEEGVKYALNYLSDIYESINETDLWADFMETDTEENN
jgi:hypothetical protein